MFGNDKCIDSMQDLFFEVRKYLELQKDYIKLDLVEKLTIILSTLILILILIILGMIALFYLSFTFAYIIAPYVGGLTGSYAIITGIIVLIIALIYIFRKNLIIRPMTNFLAKVLLNDK